jgi:hypothetical protein
MGLLDLKLILIICITIIVYFLYKEILSIRSRLNVITKQVSSISSIALIKDNMSPNNNANNNALISTSSDTISVSEEEPSCNILNMFTNMFNKKNNISVDKCTFNPVDADNDLDSCCNYNVLDANKKIHKIVYTIPSDNVVQQISDNVVLVNSTISDNVVQNTKIINIEYNELVSSVANELVITVANEPVTEQLNDQMAGQVSGLINESSEENISHLELFSNDTENKNLSKSDNNSSNTSNKSSNTSNKSSNTSNKSSNTSNKSSNTSNKSSNKSDNNSSKSSNNLNKNILVSESNTIVSEANTLASESNNNKSLTRLKLPELQDKALELKISLSINGKKKTRVELINDIRNHN